MSEPGRRLVHASGSLVPIAYVFEVLTWRQVQGLLVLALAVVTVLEGLRLSGRLDWWVYERFTRDYEAHWPAGYALALLGATATVLVFRPTVAVPALLMLTIADPISGVLSSDELAVKQGYVLLVTFGVSLGIAGLLRVPLLAAVLGAGAATVADGVKPTIAGYVIDDNLTIPVAAATAMELGLFF
ncbi:dolichol kinase [Halodesulfurarchaeum sp. HSR-GB]|uniref:dolichol kinase n=1 Tax=Halodesulfurarchaeum sp. HSR-GB TaxID=3074077 RepID=UPI00285CC981|nr:dolichol kinase [Halodesulfurarchaeum sp. HSR-GB]MDR5656110.1 dolichol kinase [Halodesulfurarchaeum sp. HSR-GB]